ncbi:GEVED domain-containing protein [Kaistella pullorum]|uniref:T9SS type A sorting domain-containing protein n=1 Tax=Kaistella pullorum TaxID=2763074 RepID=A0ABR8WKL5_9FLAO|nr:GEVED domain-containing protein [Kaistella pullorum]MBD8017611.1 T9SS type A sorting domain-containing protein [Kaistella pullorum]
MRKKLPVLAVLMLPFLCFSQNARNTQNAKESVHPKNPQLITSASLSTATAKMPSAYCLPSSDCADGDLITNVTVAGINNTTTCSTNGYGDYTAMVGTIVAGQSYPISVTVGDGWFERVSVWVDFNNNETFESSEFLGEIGAGSNNTVSTLTGNIAIPSTLAPGSYRMRVMVAATGSSNPAVTDPCAPGVYGETEDYTLKIAPVGCTTAPNGQYPTTTVTPNCNGSMYTITAEGWTGEYSSLNVTSGVNYTFKVSNAAYYITITDNAATPTILAGGTGQISWTSNITGVIRFYSHTSVACGSGTSATAHTRSVQCGTPPVEPDYGCDQTYSGTPDLASNIIKNTTLNYAVANDFFVPMESAAYKLESVTADIVPLSAAGGADISGFNIQIMSNSATDTPGTVIHTITNAAPASVTALPNTFAGYPTFAVKVNLGGYTLPVNAAADTRYWISLQAISASNTSMYWIGQQYTEGWNTKSNYISTDGGATWAQVTSDTAPGQHYDSNMMIDADCTVAAVSESGARNVSFYPNPVKDYLNIDSKIKVETVHIYNANGQKMPVSAKLVNGRVDMSRLAPGMYIVSTILENGKNESFKVVKK